MAIRYLTENFKEITMALQSTSTANAWIRDLQDRLSVRFAGSATLNSVRQAQDASGWPMLFFSVGGTETEGSPVAAIRIMGEQSPAQTDIFGNATIPFAPHVCQLAFELKSTGAPEVNFSDLATIMYEISRIGVQIQELPIANGTAVTVTSMNAASPVLTLDSIDFPNKGA
jgi:hypothetical protein